MSFDRLTRRGVVRRLERRASFLQRHPRRGAGVQPARAVDLTLRELGGIGQLETLCQRLHGRRGRGHGGFGFAAGARLAVGRGLGGLLRAIVGVEGAGQREAVVALRDRVVCLLQRGGRGGELLRRVLLGAGGARGVEGALRQVDFFLGRCRTGRQEASDRTRQAARARAKVYSGSAPERSRRRLATSAARAPWMQACEWMVVR